MYNASHLLDTLLDGYDRRLRPGFGGKPSPGSTGRKSQLIAPQRVTREPEDHLMGLLQDVGTIGH